MNDPIYLQNARKDVNRKYVGFLVNGTAIKPVHIAGGSLRCIYGKYNASKCIKQLALIYRKKDGKSPKGNDNQTVYKDLLAQEKIDKDISESSLESMRYVMQKLLDADKGVFFSSNLNNMISYSAGSKYFLTREATYEDAGEFIGGVIRENCPKLADYIWDILDKADDPISLLFKPVLDMEEVDFPNQRRHKDIPAFQNPNDSMRWYLNGIKESGVSLLDNFEHHTNPLTQLRLFNLFCIFHLIRYLMMLPAFYCNEPVRPILLDFSGKSPSMSSVARASEISYTQIYKSINRFYSWGFAEWLEENGYNKEALLNSETPMYAVNKKSKNKKSKNKNKAELDILWNLAKDKARKMKDREAQLIFGETMYDMLAMEADGNLVSYIRTLGIASGILYPPDNRHTNKRFVESQDVLEMLLRGCVGHDEVISGVEIRSRLWERFGVIVGQSNFEIEKLRSGGMILQIDGDSLEGNFSAFSNKLEEMDFAEIMADGILQIRAGGTV